MTYLNAKILPKLAPKLFPDKDVTILVVKCLVLGVLVGDSPNTQISDAGSVGGIIDALVEEELVAREHGRYPHLAADQHVDRQCERHRHAVSYNWS